MQFALVEIVGHLACRVPTIGTAEQIAAFDNVAPIMATRIEREHDHLRHGREGFEHFEHLTRQRRETEHDDAAR